MIKEYYYIIIIVLLIIAIIGMVSYLYSLITKVDKLEILNKDLLNSLDTVMKQNQKYHRQECRIQYNLDIQKNTKSKQIYQPNKKIKVLIGDYMKESATLTNSVLKKLGFDTFAVSTPEDIIDIVESGEKYDLIITNNIYKDSDLDGSHLVYELKNEYKFKKPVIVLTVSRDERYYFISECGFDEYLTKPLNKDNAIEAFTKVIPKLEFTKMGK